MSSKKNIQAENTIPAGYTLDYVSMYNGTYSAIFIKN